MLRISKLADYACVMMSAMATTPQIALSAVQIAETTHLTLPTVRKVLKQLSTKGLLISARGANGGYQLARTPQQITTADIIEAVDGPLALTECSHPHGACIHQRNCHIKNRWQGINGVVQQALQRINLQQMTQKTLN